MKTTSRVFIISLGCAKNLVDSEHILGLLQENGFDRAARIEEADSVIINTCGFIQPAVEETIDTIIEVTGLKKRGELRKIFVLGCFVQRYGYKLMNEIPEVDGWLGTGEFHHIVELMDDQNRDSPIPFHIGKPTSLADHTWPRVHTGAFYSAFLKIAEGCSHQCSFCYIPKLTGSFRSRKLKSLIKEVEYMSEQGVKEVNLIAQDITMYGRDLAGNVGLEDLLERLVKIKQIEWIRLLYCHPLGITERLLELLESEDTICPYIDIPLQHNHNQILTKMGKKIRKKTVLELIEKIRSLKRRISLRTTLMVGFPNETEEAFHELYYFVKQIRFDHIGTFIFSAEKGTAAARLTPMIPRKRSEERRAKIMELQAGISKELNKRFIGQILPVLIEGTSEESELLLKGRTSAMAPDVDGQVLINKGNAVTGRIMPVKISKAHSYDLIGEVFT